MENEISKNISIGYSISLEEGFELYQNDKCISLTVEEALILSSIIIRVNERSKS